ncbi:acyclic terpene utilization AtuA family protein [Dactylosporangium sp. CA-152071]|uniref:acyclic terpene utilization AtuA family protein n=1 Tax=Dactylosporangium sp. CA-152071 TaxID=3239933 RepID=UPI003D91E85B
MSKIGSTIESEVGEGLVVGCFSGFLGDRADGMTALLRSGVDVLVGDYLAELTMLILRKNVDRGGVGYARAFLDQIGPHLGQIAAQGVKVVVNAGGLDPLRCAADLRALCADRGVALRVAAITGDDVRQQLPTMFPDGSGPVNIDTGEALPVAEVEVLTANAYLGAWPIVEALQHGADIVVCPRATDASLVVGPAAWRFGWNRDDWSRLAGAVVAGHLIECGSQVTGGNFAFFTEHEHLGTPGMPIAEVLPNGDCVITKARDTGGIVTTDTVIAQLLYETGPVEYQNPDVITDLSTITLADLGHDRVRVTGVAGRAPTGTTKLSLTFDGGFRNSVSFGLTGRNIPQKLEWVREQIATTVGPDSSFDRIRWSVVGPAAVHGNKDQSTAIVVVTARDHTRDRIGRRGFADKFVELVTAGPPGMYLVTPPTDAKAYGVQWPSLVDKHHVEVVVHLDTADAVPVAWGPSSDERRETPARPKPDLDRSGTGDSRVAFGTLFGTRSGDKGGMANVGVWARSERAFAWLCHHMTAERLTKLLPELESLRVERHVLPNLKAVNFLVFGILEDGAASSTSIDIQAKGLGEYLAAQKIDVPAELVDDRA